MGTYNHCLIEDQVERFFGASGHPDMRKAEDYVTPQVVQRTKEREKELIMLKKQIQQATLEKRRRTQQYLQGQSNIEKAKELERRKNIQLKANKIREEYAKDTQQVAYMKEEAKVLEMRQKMDKEQLDKINRLTQKRQMTLPPKPIPTSGNVNIPAAPAPLKPNVTPSSALAPNPHLPFPVQPGRPQPPPPPPVQPSKPLKPPSASPEIPVPHPSLDPDLAEFSVKQVEHTFNVENLRDLPKELDDIPRCTAVKLIYEHMRRYPLKDIDPADEFRELYKNIMRGSVGGRTMEALYEIF